MKRAIVSIALALFFFALGWMSACWRVQSSAAWRIARAEAERAHEIAEIRQRIYGPNDFHRKGISPQDDARLARFDPATSKGSIGVSYVGGLGNADAHVQLKADGSILVMNHGLTRKIGTLEQDRCADFFRRVLTSGILNYSGDMIELKADLTNPSSHAGVLDAPDTEFQIYVPELGVEKIIALGAPAQCHLKSNPDIIEFQLAATLESEILGFLPKDDPFWLPSMK